MKYVQSIADREVQSDDETGSEDGGDGEVVTLARRCLEIGDEDGGKKTLVEG